ALDNVTATPWLPARGREAAGLLWLHSPIPLPAGSPWSSLPLRPKDGSSNKAATASGSISDEVPSPVAIPVPATEGSDGPARKVAANGAAAGKSGSLVGGSAMPCGLVLPVARAKVAPAFWLPEVRLAAPIYW